VHGIEAMTIGKLVEPDRALIWRGPRAHSAFNQLATQTKWGELDYLFVDLPPGTGDVPLSLAQLLPLTGAVIVCTPQVVAQDDARRAVRMFQQLGAPILGLVENMSYFVADDGKEYDIFGRGGGEQLAASMNLAFLGSIPIHPDMRIAADTGEPLKNWDINDTMSKAFDTVCTSLSTAADSSTPDRPTLTIH
jgi:ATP-binding protein involved in chromosome partitioning